MASKQVALEVSGFLDSVEAGALAGIAPEQVRRVAELFVELGYQHVDKAPRFLDGDDLREMVTRLLPARLARNDPLAEHVPAVLAAYVEHLSSAHLTSQGFELRRALDGSIGEFRAAVSDGRYAHRLATAKPTPYAHGAPKLGRNDPCSCGSGRKYKKCHGQES